MNPFSMFQTPSNTQYPSSRPGPKGHSILRKSIKCLSLTLGILLAATIAFTLSRAYNYQKSQSTTIVARKFPPKADITFRSLNPGGPPLYGYISISKDGTPFIRLDSIAWEDNPIPWARCKIYRLISGQYVARLSRVTISELEQHRQSASRFDKTDPNNVPLLIEESK